MIVVILIIALLTPVSVLQAATYYVATTGSNTNDGLSESTPWLTVQKAVNTMIAGDTTYVRGGLYNEGLIQFKRSGTQSAPIKLLNYPGESPIIDFINPTNFDRILIQNSAGSNVAVGWLTIEGFELRGGYEGIKFHNLHNSVIRRNWMHDNINQGILGAGGHHNVIDRNIINHNGGFDDCATFGTTNACKLEHGLYMHGDAYTVTNNIVYDNLAFSIQHNGSSTSEFTTARHPSAEFSGAANWVVSNNLFGYENQTGAIVIWGSLTSGSRYENNIFYENYVTGISSNTNGIQWTNVKPTGIQIRNNHFYASGSGGTISIVSDATEGVHYTQSGNSFNTTAPGFVNGGSNALPASPDFSLASGSPLINSGVVNEFAANGTPDKGPFESLPTPTASITANVLSLTYAMGANVPIQIGSIAGLSITCTANPTACPSSPTITTAARKTGVDNIIDITISGISGNACATGQDWKISYNSATGTITDSAKIGPEPGLNQKAFSFTNLLATNACTGSGPSGYPAGYHIFYQADEGTGTNLNDESANNLDGTLVGGWGLGKSGNGVVLTASSTQSVSVPWGSGINPTTQSFTVAFGVFVDPANVNLGRTYAGAPLGASQRWYVSTLGGTWRIGIQGSSDSTASDLAVTSGWHQIVIQMDKDTPGSGTGTATLCVDTICSNSAGGKKTYTSYTLAGNIEWGRLSGLSNGPGGTFDDFLLYLNTSVSLSALFDAFNAAPPVIDGTFSQIAVQHQSPYLVSPGFTPFNFGTLTTTQNVVVGGGLATAVEIKCNTGVDCGSTAFRYSYRVNGTGSWQQVPTEETSAGLFMWGTQDDGNQFFNRNPLLTSLTGTCTVTASSTLRTAEQIPTITLAQGECATLRYVVRIGNFTGIARENLPYFELRVEKEGGIPFAGTYVLGRINVVPPGASAGF